MLTCGTRRVRRATLAAVVMVMWGCFVHIAVLLEQVPVRTLAVSRAFMANKLAANSASDRGVLARWVIDT